MLSFIRSITKSRIGLIAIFVLLGIIAIAFAAGDLTGVRPTGTGDGAVVARVGDREITERELRERVGVAMDNMRRQGRTIEISQFIEQGGVEDVLDQMINNAAIGAFAEETGMFAGQRIIDADIASNPRFHGVDGKFDQALFTEMLRAQRIPEKALRDDLQSAKYADWLLRPAVALGELPMQLVLPYASLQLERRKGQFAFVPAAAMKPVADPDEKAVTEYYNRNKARYTVPERRVIRYVIVKPETLRQQVTVTDADLAAAYKGSGNRFAATEKRTFNQLIVLDKATADKVAAQVRGGQSIADAARALGLEPSTFQDVEKPELTSRTSQAVADAAFSAAKGSVVGPVESPLGFHILRVELVEKVPAQSLADARPTLENEIRTRKTAEAMIRTRDTIDDALGGGSTFDEIVAQTKLQPQKTEPVVASGINPDKPGSEANPELTPVLRAGFMLRPNDDPQLVPVSQDGTFALVGLETVVPAKLKPLAQVRDTVVANYKAEQARQAAREIAADLVRKVNGGMALPEAVASASVALPRTVVLNATRAELTENAQRAPPPPQVSLMFAMPKGTAKLVEAPDGTGYFVVYLAELEEAKAEPGSTLVDQMVAAMSQMIPAEYAEQFVAALRKSLGVTRNEKALAEVRDSLLRNGTSGV